MALPKVKTLLAEALRSYTVNFERNRPLYHTYTEGERSRYVDAKKALEAYDKQNLKTN